MKVATYPRQLVDIFRRRLEPLVFLKPADQFGTRVEFVLLHLGRARQQHARLDLSQHGRHYQVLGRKLQAHGLHQLDIAHVLTSDFRDRDIENIDVLLADQIEQQIQRSLECLKEDLERIWGDIEILRQVIESLAVDKRQPQLLAGRLEGRLGLGVLHYLSGTNEYWKRRQLMPAPE